MVAASACYYSSDSTASHLGELWLGPTTGSVTGAYCGAMDTIDESGVVGVGPGRSLYIPSFKIVLAVTPTVYLSSRLNANVGAGHVYAEAATLVSSIPNITGFTATRIA